MSEQETVVETTPNDTPEVDVVALQAQLADLTAENAKLKSIKTQAFKERDELKGKLRDTQSDKPDDYKQLYHELSQELEKEKVARKREGVNKAIMSKLTKLGVMEGAVDAALKLVDTGLIDLGSDSLDEIGIDTAVKKLAEDYKFLFEKPATTVPPKLPGDGKDTKTQKTMVRSAFDKLQPAEKVEAIKKGVVITDK